MNVNSRPLNSLPHKNHGIFAPILASALIAGLIVGGSVYAYQKNLQAKTETDLRMQLGYLEDQMKKTTAAIPSASPPSSPQESSSQTWVAKSIPELKVAFDYPAKLGAFQYTIGPFGATSSDTGTAMSASVGGTAGDPSSFAPLNLYAQSKDFTSPVGRGAGFLDLDGYEKVGNSFKVFTYDWTTGKKNPSSDATDDYSNPREVSTKSFTALMVERKALDRLGGLGKNTIGAIIPLQQIGNYYALVIQGDTTKISTADFISVVKSFRLANQ